jgi:hypothetical protein
MQKILLLLLFSLFLVSVPAQTPTATPAAVPSGIKANLAVGEVSSVNQSGNKIVLQTSDGAIEVIISSATVFKRVPPENPTLAAAVAAALSDIGENDKIVVTGAVSADKKTIPAKTVYLMTKSDISKRNQAEKELWRTRGISGRVVSVDFKTRNITLATRSISGETNITVSPKENAEFLRYSADSVKFADTVASNLAEIKVGDQLRALGDRGTDGLTFQAEKYVSGTFRTIAGKITAIDMAKNEITIENAQDKKQVTVVLKNDTSMKRFPPEQAQMMAAMMSGGGGMRPGQGGQGGNMVVMRPPQGGQPAGQTPPNTGNAGAPAGQPGGANGQNRPEGRQGGRGRADFDEILDRLPNLTLAEIKVGEMIGISTSPGTAPDRFTAIKLISGIEPFLTMPQVNAGGGRGNQQAPSFNIPGLDGGIGTP